MRQVWISHDVLDRVKDEAQNKAPLETGGILIGYISEDDDHVVVTDMAGPGPQAKHRKWKFRPDYIFHQDELSLIFDESEGTLTYLGDWHSHPATSPYLSFLDKRALRNIARFPDNYIGRPIMLVLGGDDNRNTINWTPYVWRISPLKRRLLWSAWEYIPLEITVFDRLN